MDWMPPKITLATWKVSVVSPNSEERDKKINMMRQERRNGK